MGTKSRTAPRARLSVGTDEVETIHTDVLETDPGTGRTRRGAIRRDVEFDNPHALERQIFLSKVAAAYGLRAIRSYHAPGERQRLTLTGFLPEIEAAIRVYEAAEPEIIGIMAADAPVGHGASAWRKAWVSGMGEEVAAKITRRRRARGLRDEEVRSQKVEAEFRRAFPRVELVARPVKCRAGFEAGAVRGRGFRLPSDTDLMSA